MLHWDSELLCGCNIFAIVHILHIPVAQFRNSPALLSAEVQNCARPLVEIFGGTLCTLGTEDWPPHSHIQGYPRIWKLLFFKSNRIDCSSTDKLFI